MNDRVKTELIEEFMPRAVELALLMDDGTVPVEDLTQEAYLGLVTGVEAIARAEGGDLGGLDRLPIRETIEDAIRMQIRAALSAEAAARARDERLVLRAELLSQARKELIEELGVMPTADELAKAMRVSREVVEETLKLMGETAKEEEAFGEPSEGFWFEDPDLQGLRR